MKELDLKQMEDTKGGFFGLGFFIGFIIGLAVVVIIGINNEGAYGLK